MDEERRRNSFIQNKEKNRTLWNTLDRMGDLEKEDMSTASQEDYLETKLCGGQDYLV